MADYCTWQQVARYLNMSGSGPEEVLTRNVGAAMDVVHQHCGWRFDSTEATYVFHAGHPYDLDLGDLPLAGTPTSVATDEDDDGVYETTVSASAFVLRPANGRYNGRTWPYTTVHRTTGEWPRSVTGRPVVEITGPFGWPNVPTAVVEATIQLAGWIHTNKAVPNLAEFVPADLRPPVQLLGPYRRPDAILAVATGRPR